MLLNLYLISCHIISQVIVLFWSILAIKNNSFNQAQCFSRIQVVCVVHNFKGKHLLSEEPPQDHMSSNPMVSSPRVDSPLEKYIASQVHGAKNIKQWWNQAVRYINIQCSVLPGVLIVSKWGLLPTRCFKHLVCPSGVRTENGWWGIVVSHSERASPEFL